MSPRYNNQWVLGRSRRRRRTPAAVGGTYGQAVVPLRPEPHVHQPSPGPGGAVRKRPCWIDRDT